MHLPNLIVDLALILITVAITGILFKFLKQPVVLGYILAGFIVGPHTRFFPSVIEQENIRIWADIGVIILLFNLGLEFSFKKLFREGARIVVIALFGILLTALAGYIMGRSLGWNNMDSVFMGGMLSIASTTIIIRAFEELNVKTQKFTNIVTSILIVEDIAAVILMVGLTTISISREFSGAELIFSFLKLLFFLVLWFVCGIFFLPTLIKLLKPVLNEEILLLFSLALCFLVVNMALKAGFSPAFGAFIIGSILAETTKAEKIEHLIAPLKNLFGSIFFVSVGMMLNPGLISEYIFPIVMAVILLLIGKPLFIITGSLLTGNPLKMSIQTGLSLSQIGEFSFIIATLGLSLNVTSGFLYPVAVTVSVLTAFTTPYMIRISEPSYKFLNLVLPQKVREKIDRYSVVASKINEVREWPAFIKQLSINILIYSVIVTFIILVIVKYLQPIFWDYKYSRVITAALSILLISPFLWAISFRQGNSRIYAKILLNREYRSPMIIVQIARISISLFFLGFLFHTLFSPRFALSGLIITLLLLFFFRGKLQIFYNQLERRFIANLNERELERKGKSTGLTPWDTHLSTIRIHANTSFIGKTLLESRIRENFGVNIAAIERDGIFINVPDRYERLYPNDVISVIGTDLQLSAFADHIDSSEESSDILKKKNDIKLLHFTIDKDSILNGKTIKDSNVREATKGLVVGIERKGVRILNPESGEYFMEDDVIWIVGNEKRIKIIADKKTDA
jgi:monovalent cation:H+ antiporter-2, CPA2 family